MLISPSSITRFVECPEKFWLSRECKPLPLKTEVMEFGYVLHQIIAEYYKMLMSSNNVTPSEFEAKLAVAAKKCGINEQLFKRYRWHFKNFLSFENKRISWSVDIKPVAVEKKFTKKPFYGIVDAIFKKEDGYIVVDWKSGKSYENLPDYYKIQGCVYRYITGISDVVFYFLIDGTYKRIEVTDCQEITGKVNEILTAVKKGVRYKKRGEHCKMCEYQIACLYNATERWLDDSYWIRATAKRA